MLAAAGPRPFMFLSESLIISDKSCSSLEAERHASRNCPKNLLFCSFSYMSGMRNLGFQKKAWEAPLKTCFCSVIEFKTTSRDEPLKSFPKVPFFISLITCLKPVLMARKEQSLPRPSTKQVL